MLLYTFFKINAKVNDVLSTFDGMLIYIFAISIYNLISR